MSLKTLVRLAPTVLILSGLAAMHPAAAQFITFGAAQTISGAGDVSTTGTLVDAYDFSGSSATVNGVLFSSMASVGGTGNLSISFPSTSTSTANFATAFGSSTSGTAFSSLGGSYQNLLTNGLYENGQDPFSLTESGLTPGERYQVQYFVNDSRALAATRAETVTSSGGNSQALSYNSTGADGGVGQYVNGTFTATTAGTVTLTAASSVSAQINGLQFRDLGNAGAPITFGSATRTLTAGGVLTTPAGTIIYAADFGAGDQTVTLGSGKVITFDGNSTKATVVGGNGTFTGAFSGDTGNTNFNAVLNSANYDSAAGTKQITLSNLIAGKQYSVQLFGLDDRTASSARTFSFSDFSGDSTASIINNSNRNVIGTFTAASSFETITENIPNGGNINALVVRDLSVVSAAPEPSQIASLALAALGMLGVVLKARKRKAAAELS